ncbi:MAG TPA: hypothetical protein VK474_10510, partial [Chthoniobacterales bacterium]|nr:hypothetical protein [Chthoniobacterales bacterium]
MRSHALLLCCFLSLSVVVALSQPRDTGLKSPLRVRGREVTGLIVTGPIRVGAPLPAGLPTAPVYTIRPNRFSPVREDGTGVYFQAEGAFAEGSGGLGGLCVTRTALDEIYAYRGDGRYPKIYLPFVGQIQPADLAKIRIQ